MFFFFFFFLIPRCLSLLLLRLLYALSLSLSLRTRTAKVISKRAPSPGSPPSFLSHPCLLVSWPAFPAFPMGQSELGNYLSSGIKKNVSFIGFPRTPREPSLSFSHPSPDDRRYTVGTLGRFSSWQGSGRVKMCLKSEFPNVSLLVDDFWIFLLAWGGLCLSCVSCLVSCLSQREARSIIIMSVVS